MGNSASKKRLKFEATLEGMRSNEVSGKVKFKRYGLDPEDATKLADALRQNETVTDLILWDNRIGPIGAGTIAKALTSSLQVLDLGGCGIGDLGASYLASALEKNSTLQELYLQDNDIGDAGAKSIARALRTNTTLRTLYLHVNNIGTEGMCELIRALKCNGTLKTLETYANNAPVDITNQLLHEGGSSLKKGG
mmetsp:Transcript_10761/g.31854  ORF Transcript_10761/g.31854 Transcript_10761/m.31854 type:complete len:194 (-) Transcript_10761:310-891(-)|eukprot:CAMPEP_0113545592 /NCGR_PEP_ID=MMETSP0015_2-20120614/11345_1 /TAXON_ID=2838 /ORGANISM="Odontella" /LENGTH=193 /DNA_ID=CAMNT_0000445971 /DNA_START=313 /DNA_END=894 /DNA_ORIENTATION=+ /assembly_acc=CAM_ASM_000160